MLTRFLKAWPYVAKGLDFLHLLEDNMTRLSLTGAQMWLTTALNFHTQLVSHDHVMAGMAMGTNFGAMVAHGYKRTQAAKAAPDPLPPWHGEAD